MVKSRNYEVTHYAILSHLLLLSLLGTKFLLATAHGAPSR
jgi:hypothetical protein